MTDQKMGSSLDEDLRRILAARQRAAPLPANLLQVPDRWVRSRPSLVPLASRALAVSVVVVVAALLAGQLPRLADLRLPAGALTAEVAASLAGVPLGQVLETQDGYVAVRFSSGPKGLIELLLINSDAGENQVRRLTTGQLDPRVLETGIVTLNVFHLSCVPATGLAQPDFVFGYSQFDDVFPAISLNGASRGTSQNGLFVFTLHSAAEPPGWLTVTARSSDRPDLGGSEHLPPTAFDHEDRCEGEPADSVGDGN